MESSKVCRTYSPSISGPATPPLSPAAAASSTGSDPNRVELAFCTEGSQATAEAINEAINQALDTGATWGQGIADEVSGIAEPALWPLTAYPQVTAQTLNTDVREQAASLTDGAFADLRESLTDWDGLAAEDFRAYLDGKLRAATANQAILSAGIAAALAATATTFRSTRLSLLNVATGVRQRTEAQIAMLEDRYDEPDTTHQVLMLASAAASVLSAVPHPATAISASAISAILGLAADAIPAEDQDPITIDAEEATALATLATQHSTTTLTRCDAHFHSIQQHYVTPLEDMVTDWTALRLLRPDRPDIADGATTTSDFGFAT